MDPADDVLAELMEAFNTLPLDAQEALADKVEGVALERDGTDPDTGSPGPGDVPAWAEPPPAGATPWAEIERFLADGLSSLLLPLHLYGQVELAMIADGAADAVVEEFSIGADDEATTRSRVVRRVDRAFERLEGEGVLTRTPGPSAATGPLVELTPDGRTMVAHLLGSA